MKPAPFEYYAPSSLTDAVDLLAQLDADGCDMKIIAGGQSLMPMLALRVARPEALVDLRLLGELDYIRKQEDGTLAIGAMTSKQAAVDSPLVKDAQPLFHAATELVGHRQIRNRGSVGGSFAHADPASEYPAVALVLDTEFDASGHNGPRTIPAQDFFVTYMTTALESTDILTAVRFAPFPYGRRWAIQEFSRRNGDLALAGVALAFNIEAGLCRDVRIAAFGVEATAVRLTAAEQMLEGRPAQGVEFERAGKIAAAALDDPMSCIHASSEYRRHLVGVLTARALGEAAARSN
ncbi:MAG: xanthine dehydrogenase family protein subunit M [Comamonadaceae bacterium]|nr:xanthine dehydrogenase family protein subunit M [Pseudomonadota bacterium]MBS0608083.1 xanthine dehydrogenase family protein subunit M [Pseudomonadota bacterium]MDE2413397.1 xanthine dehydrogenase family protein subunit M [Comamonadaceae bacterium]